MIYQDTLLGKAVFPLLYLVEENRAIAALFCPIADSEYQKGVNADQTTIELHN